jgi:hypothetical protein
MGTASNPISPVVQGREVLAVVVVVVDDAAGVEVVLELDELLPQPASSTTPASAAISERVAIGRKGSWC